MTEKMKTIIWITFIGFVHTMTFLFFFITAPVLAVTPTLEIVFFLMTLLGIVVIPLEALLLIIVAIFGKSPEKEIIVHMQYPENHPVPE